MSATSTRVRVRGWWLVLLAGLALVLVPWPSALIDTVYSQRVYPTVQALVTSGSNLSALAIIDPGLIVIVVWTGWRVVRLVPEARAGGWAHALWTFTRRLVRVAGVIVVLFYLNWGLNYRRAPLESVLGGGADTSTAAVTEAVAYAATRASALRAAGHKGVEAYADAAVRLEPAFQDALRQLNLPPLAKAGRPKVSHVLTPFYTAAGVTGMVNPVALESIVHPDLLPFERPLVLAHEWAHLAGYADEADASAVGWAACMRGDADLQYAAHMFLLLEGASQMPRKEWATIRAGLDPGVLADFAALAKRLTRQQPVVRQTANRVYDQYLKTNQVEDGVRSYGRAVRVLLTPKMRALRR